MLLPVGIAQLAVAVLIDVSVSSRRWAIGRRRRRRPPWRPCHTRHTACTRSATSMCSSLEVEAPRRRASRIALISTRLPLPPCTRQFWLLNEFLLAQVEPSGGDVASFSSASSLKLTHVSSLDTGTGATMNLALDDIRTIAAGQDDSCHVYSYVLRNCAGCMREKVRIIRMLPNVTDVDGGQPQNGATAKKVAFDISPLK